MKNSMFLSFPLAFGEKSAWNLHALQHFVLKICTYLPWESCPIETAPLLKCEHNVNYNSIKCYMTLNYRINVIPLTFSSLSAFFSAVFPANVLHTVNKSYNVVFFLNTQKWRASQTNLSLQALVSLWEPCPL